LKQQAAFELQQQMLTVLALQTQCCPFEHDQDGFVGRELMVM